MAVTRLQAILACLTCLEPKDAVYPDEKASLLRADNTRPAAAVADDVVNTMLHTSLVGPALHMQLDSIVGAYGWKENIAKSVLEKLSLALQNAHEKLGPAMRDAYHKAWEVAKSIQGFVIEHPVIACTREITCTRFITRFFNCIPVLTLPESVLSSQMELWAFGFNSQSPSAAKTKCHPTSAATLKAEAIKVLWSSWCDAVIANQDTTGSQVIEYRGTGLTTAQKNHIVHSKDIRDTLGKDETRISFFGSAMHDGLRGYAISSEDDSATTNHIGVFATDLELAEGLQEVQSHSIHGDHKILDIQVTSGGEVLLSMTNRSTTEGQIVRVPSVAELRSHLAQHTSPDRIADPPLACFAPTQWATNASSSTILDHDGKVYTSTWDPRYSKCIGRPYEGTPSFEPVPYLSETNITKVASGGYMTAAVSSDGELFLWGQSCPGSQKELELLSGKETLSHNGSEARPDRTGVWVEGEQDEFVKCLTVYIDGEEATVYDIAVGHGHVLVAARVSGQDGGRKCALFAAGNDSRGQLGLNRKGEFAENFGEVVTLKGKWIEQIVAGGWSSFVLTTVR
ncbi:hypothetical protein N0V83_006082 [Neocucurbitaria cava]|uniref:Uncharacterized protein n=1 Tax=Neocucurbitaria cava TaxID=798079 RepID=A0A9W9CLM5_9PLEO|nr:hypothetical protein N0V83_006082 [Neocucurbitaria cava]